MTIAINCVAKHPAYSNFLPEKVFKIEGDYCCPDDRAKAIAKAKDCVYDEVVDKYGVIVALDITIVCNLEW